jgi:lipopolysaccharide transport system permease protein
MSASVSQLELTKPLTPDSPPPQPAVDLNDQPEMVIRPRKGWIAVDWRELWNYRELLYFLVWRDVKVRYKQAILGIAWAVLAPLMSVIVFTLIFGKRGLGSNTHLPPDLQNHTSLFIFAGLIPWLFLSQAISNGGMALVNSQHMLTKIYLPRLFIPASTIGSTMVDMLIAFGVFCLMMLFTGYTPSPLIVLLPLVVLLTVLLALGMAFALSAMTVTYRDLRFLIPFITQIGMWISAVVFPYKGVGALAKHEWILLFNPFFGIIDTFRTCLFGAGEGQWGWRPWHLLASIVWTLAILAFGLFYFRKTERRFADIA